ncbi:hypothetical protein Airi01_022060 [Actinoallomurus iriomotensis]|uniref:Thioesterase domain-containing protein n=1 Tax=Actinoallomurus iriomotensis TaxID=478107 RepID=A0A9W6RDN9_9ACTN|nr:hypothetical protein Airi01_022060 [Actinoallomurus iriomotensis]
MLTRGRAPRPERPGAGRDPYASRSATAHRPGRRRGRVSTLVALRRTGSSPPLFVVCAGHGDVLAVAQLARLLDDEQPCYALQAPLDLDLPRAELFDALLNRYLADIASVSPAGPLVLAGNSCGGYLALELARRMRHDGPPPLVALLDTPCRITGAGYAADRFGRWLARRASFADRDGAPRWIRTAYAMWTDRGHEVHVRATAGYRPAPYPGPVVLFRAQVWRLRGLTPSGVYVSARRWASVTRAGFDVVDVPGHHWSFLREPRVRVLADRLGAVLAGTEVPR